MLEKNDFARKRNSKTLCCLFVVFSGLLCLYLRVLYSYRNNVPRADHKIATASASIMSKALVVASLAEDDTRWIYENLSGWEVKRYVVNGYSAPFTVPINKGNEAMAYLS